MNKTQIIAEAGSHEIVIIRTFDAPRDLVFKAHVDAKYVARWWGPRTVTTVIDQLEARSGGGWRYVQRDAEGNEYAFHGVFHEVAAPERYVQTFEAEFYPGHVMLETVSFTEHDGKTTLTSRSIYQSVEDRDGMISSGMEEGTVEGFERVDELLAELQAIPA